MSKVAQVGGDLKGAQALLRRFVNFRNQFWFNEVTRKPVGGDLYRQLQQGLEVNELYQMVTDSVKEAKEYYQEQWDRRVKLLYDLLSFVLGPVVATITAGGLFLAGEYPFWVKV